ncbi:MAG: hypothetical protein JWQ81_2817 [Amycolatopsis sp.]|uniref:hypothetical protein n=1 Tax=Amycolatopsis sp. TaxID=37632 RepID=UPI0026175B44|nr:hypothetical protein [Amycolatopsis sp.]MCU1682078.1 hypothetical protein [Amycolatopsis sp.]
MTDTGGQSAPEEPDAPTPSQGVPVPGAQSEGPPAPPVPPEQPPAQPAQWAQPAPYQQPYQQPHQQFQPTMDPRWHPNGLGRPGVIALRPLNVGDILDGAIKAIRRHPGLILGVSAIFAVIAAGLNLVASLWLLPDIRRVSDLGPAATQQELLNQSLTLLGESGATLAITLAITMFLRGILTGFLTVVMGKAVLGKPITFAQAMREAAPRWGSLIGLVLVYVVATFVGAILCLVGAVVPYVLFALAAPALMLERSKLGQALTRSRQLVAGSFWRVLGILLLASIIGGVLSGIIQIPFSLGSGLFSGLFNPGSIPVQSTGGLVLQSVGVIIVDTLITPFVTLVTVLIYIDQRMRKEGMDIELARVAGITPPTPPQAW